MVRESGWIWREIDYDAWCEGRHAERRPATVYGEHKSGACVWLCDECGEKEERAHDWAILAHLAECAP